MSKKTEYVFEKFPKPRTYPAKWNTAEMISDKHLITPAKSNGNGAMEKFPKPRTFPEKWSMSELTK
ncbi:MAG: hypothetical protein MAG431_00062 [Chloroflexi bacterium]|nr:hypothetical protein [Chloroflexota bacterium]